MVRVRMITSRATIVGVFRGSGDAMEKTIVTTDPMKGTVPLHMYRVLLVITGFVLFCFGENILEFNNEVVVDEFACNGSELSCIPTTWKCDNERDCADGSDEAHCNTTCDPWKFTVGLIFGVR